MLKASHIFLSRIFLWDFSDHPLRLRKMEFYYLGSVFYSKYLIEGYELKKKSPKHLKTDPSFVYIPLRKTCVLPAMSI